MCTGGLPSGWRERLIFACLSRGCFDNRNSVNFISCAQKIRRLISVRKKRICICLMYHLHIYVRKKKTTFGNANNFTASFQWNKRIHCFLKFYISCLLVPLIIIIIIIPTGTNNNNNSNLLHVLLVVKLFLKFGIFSEKDYGQKYNKKKK